MVVHAALKLSKEKKKIKQIYSDSLLIKKPKSLFSSYLSFGI